METHTNMHGNMDVGISLVTTLKCKNTKNTTSFLFDIYKIEIERMEKMVS